MTFIIKAFYAKRLKSNRSDPGNMRSAGHKCHRTDVYVRGVYMNLYLDVLSCSVEVWGESEELMKCLDDECLAALLVWVHRESVVLQQREAPPLEESARDVMRNQQDSGRQHHRTVSHTTTLNVWRSGGATIKSHVLKALDFSVFRCAYM